MNKPTLIRDVTDLVVFEPAIKLQALSADLENPRFNNYILTQDLADLYAKVLSSILGDGWGSTASTLPAERRRSHLISAQYGTGKSYFLTVLSALLSAGGDSARLQTAKRKFEAFPEVRQLLNLLSDKKFLVIQISAEDKGDIRFRELIVRSLLTEIKNVLPDAAFSNEYTLAIEQLEELEKEDFAPVRERFVQILDEQFGFSLQQLRARLGAYDRDSLRTYYQGWERAVGLKVSRDVLNLETTLPEALELLKPQGYTHIAILVDELTAYLSASAGHHSLADTLGELQSFAAYCNRPTSCCLSAAAMHVSLETFLKERSQQRDFDKMRGRFDEHAFPIYSSKLLAGVFRSKPLFNKATERYRRQVEALEKMIDAFKMTDDGKPLRLAEFFPLHPAVAHYLPPIARELGQAERTSFGFVDEVVRKKLDEPLVAEGRLNLLTLDQVFDYFLPAMEQKWHYVQVISAFNAVQSRIASPMADRVFKLLALLWVASRVRSDQAYQLQVDLSRDEVAAYLVVDDDRELEEALQALSNTGSIYFDRSTGKYFYIHGDIGWDLETEIQDKMVDIDADQVLADALRNWQDLACLQAPTAITVKVDRPLESQRITLDQLKQAATLRPKRAEGLVVFVVPHFSEMENFEHVFSDVALKARSLSASNVAVAIPKKVSMLNRTELLRYRALQEIDQQLDLGKPGTINELRFRLTRARYSEVEARVRSDIEEFGHASNYIFFVNHQPQEAQSLNTILENMFEHYYYKFPKVKVERINGRATTNALIDQCIVNPNTTFTSDTSEVARQARDTLQILGLCSWEKAAGGKYVVELREPASGSEGYEIWKIVLDTLTDTSRTPFAALYKRLGGPPYGLPEYMVELYIAAARALKKVHILDNEGRMRSAGKDLVTDITRYKDKRFQVFPAREAGVSYPFICSVWKAIDEPLGLRNYQELEKSLGRTIDDQRTWFNLKQDSNNLLANRLGQVQEALKSIEAGSLRFDLLVRHLEQIRRILIPAEGFEQLGKLAEELSGVKTGDDPDAAALGVRQVIESVEDFLASWGELQPAYRQFRRLLQSPDVGERFDAVKVAEQAWQNYRTEAFSASDRQEFIDKFRELWKEYVEQYIDEHNAVAKARAGYGKKLQGLLAYELLSEFDRFEFQGVSTRASFEAQIDEVRRQACRPLSRDAMLDYQQFGRVSCATCGYRLGTDTRILEQLQRTEDSLTTSVNNALSSYLLKTGQLLASESIRVYCQEKASSEEKTTIASAQDLVSKDQAITAAQGKKLRALLSDIASIRVRAEEYARQQAKKREELRKQLEEEEERKRRPRVSTVYLGDSVRTFLLASGLEAMTQEDMEAHLADWQRHVAKEFKPQA